MPKICAVFYSIGRAYRFSSSQAQFTGDGVQGGGGGAARENVRF